MNRLLKKCFGRKARWIYTFCLVALFVALFFGYQYANGVAKSKIREELERINRGPVSIDSAQIGFNSITVHGLRLREESNGFNQSTEPWMAVEKTKLYLPLWPAIARGEVDVQLIELVQADVDLQIDDSGQLINPIVTSSDPNQSIPDVQISKGKIAVHQSGKKTFVLEDVDVDFRKKDFPGAPQNTGDAVGVNHQVAVDVGDFLGGNFAAEINIQDNLISLNGTFDSVEIDSSDLSRMPYLEDYLPNGQFKGAISGAISCELVDAELKDYRLSLNPTFSNIAFDGSDLKIADVRGGNVVISPSRITIDNLSAIVLEGRIKVDSKLDLRDGTVAGPIQLDAQGAQMEAICNALNLPVDMRGPVTFKSNLTLFIDDEKLVIDGDTVGVASQFTVETLPSDEVQTKVKLDRFTQYFDSNRAPNKSGFIYVDCHNDNVDIGATIKNLGTRYKVPLPEVSGFGTVQVDVVVPADSSGAKDAYTADIKVNATQWDLSGIPFGRLETDMTLYPDHYAINNAKSTSKKDEDVALVADLDWSSQESLIFRLDRSQLAASLLSHYFGNSDFHLAGNLELAGEMTAVRGDGDSIRSVAKGKVQCKSLEIDKVVGEDVSAELKLDGYQLYLNELAGDFHGGKILGDLEICVDKKEIGTSLTFKSVDVCDLVEAYGVNVAPEVATARVDATGSLQLNLAPFDVDSKVKFDIAQGSVFSTEGLSGSGELAISKESLNVKTLSAKLKKASLSASGDLQFSTQKMNAEYQLDNFLINKIPDIAPDSQFKPEKLAGALTLSGNVSGPINEFRVDGEGRLTGFRVNSADLDRVNFDYKVSPTEFSLRNLEGRLSGGKVFAEALIPFVDGFSTELVSTFENVDFNDFAETWLPEDLPVQLGGRVSGGIEFAANRNTEQVFGIGDDAILRIDFSGATVERSGVKVEDIVGEIENYDGQTEIKLNGKLFQGNASVEISRGGTDSDKESPNDPVNCRLKVDRVSLRQLLEVSQVSPLEVDAVSSVDCTVQFSLEKFSDFANASNSEMSQTKLNELLNGMQVTGNASFDRLTLDRQMIARSVTARIAAKDGMLNVDNLDAAIGAGSVVGNASVPLDSRLQNGKVDLEFRRVDLKNLKQFSESLGRDVHGTANVRLRGTIKGNGRKMRINGFGQAELTNAHAFDVDLDLKQTAFDWSFVPSENQVGVNTRNATISAFGGKTKAQIKFQTGRRTSFEVNAKIANVKSSELVEVFASQRVSDRGEVYGDLKLSSSNFRTTSDLKASFRGSLKQTQAFKLPVLNNLNRYVNQSQVTNRRFEEGEIDLTLQNNLLTVKQFSFADGRAQVLVDGKARIDGRLDLNVILHIGRDNRDQLWELLNSRLLASASPPVALVLRIEELLADRMLFFKVGGNIKRPRIKVETSKIFRQEVIKFILDKTYNPSGRSNSLLKQSPLQNRR